MLGELFGWVFSGVVPGKVALMKLCEGWIVQFQIFTHHSGWYVWASSCISCTGICCFLYMPNVGGSSESSRLAATKFCDCQEEGMSRVPKNKHVANPEEQLFTNNTASRVLKGLVEQTLVGDIVHGGDPKILWIKLQ